MEIDVLMNELIGRREKQTHDDLTPFKKKSHHHLKTLLTHFVALLSSFLF
jgi:hypothetical protein